MPFAAPDPSPSSPEIDLPEFALPAILPDDIATLKALLFAQHNIYAAAVEVAVADAVKTAVAAAVAATRLETQAEMRV